MRISRYLIGSALALLLLPIPLRWDRYQFFLVIAMLALATFSAKPLPKQDTLHFQNIDFCWLGFLVIGVLQLLFCENGSFILHYGFIWSFFFLVSFNFRHLGEKKEFVHFVSSSINIVFIVSTITIAAGLVIGEVGISLQEESPSLWNSLFGYNGNYLSATLVCLSPFGFLRKYKSWKEKSLGVIVAGLLGFVLFSAEVKGASVVFGILLIFYIYYHLGGLRIFRNKQRILIPVLVLICMLILFFLGSVVQADEERTFMVSRSLELFRANSILGLGWGGWFPEAYNANISNYLDQSELYYTTRTGNHILPLLFLSENGILGTVLFGVPIVVIMWKGFGYIFKNSSFNYLPFAVAIIAYFGLSCFYETMGSFIDFFSRPQFVCFLSLGVLSILCKSTNS